MTVCPIALAVTCKKCPAFSACPLKSVLGDHKPDDKTGSQPSGRSPGGSKPK